MRGRSMSRARADRSSARLAASGLILPVISTEPALSTRPRSSTSPAVSGASALRFFDYLTRLSGAKTGMEAIEISGAHYRNQLTALGEYADNVIDFAREMRAICLDRS